MQCPACGTENPEGTERCAMCGNVLAQGSEPRGELRTSPLAIVSLVLGLLSFCLVCVAGVPAIVLGIWALVDIRKRPEVVKGKGLAWAGIVLGLIGTILTSIGLFITGWTWLEESHPRLDDAIRVQRAEADLRILATGIEAYTVDYEVRPPALAPCLTTPVAYLPRVPVDPFWLDQQVYSYAAAGRYYALRSLGPDRDTNLDLSALVEAASAAGGWDDADKSGVYDRGNGLRSAGDILRTGE